MASEPQRLKSDGVSGLRRVVVKRNLEGAQQEKL